MSQFSKRLQQLREGRGWSKTRLAKHIGVSLSTYANWEYGIAEPDIETIKKICLVLGVSADALLSLANKKETDLDKMLDDARSYDGKPMTPLFRHKKRAFQLLIIIYFLFHA